MEQVIGLLEKLSLNPDKSEALDEIKLALSSLHLNEIENVLKSTSIGPLLECFTSANEAELAYDILQKLLPAYKVRFVISQFGKELKDGLNLPDPLVKQLVLQQIIRCASWPEEFVTFLSDQSVLIRIVSLQIDSDLLVVQYAQDILIKLAGLNEGLDLLFAPVVLQQLHEVMNENETIRFRVLEVIITISALSPHCLEKCAQANLLSRLLSDASCRDVLVQLNALQLLAKLAAPLHGLMYLERIGVVRKLEQMLNNTNFDYQARLFLTGLYKFFGDVGKIHPQKICTEYTNFTRKMYDAIISSDSFSSTPITEISIHTLAALGSTAAGKMALNNCGDQMIEVMKNFGRLVQNSTMDEKVATLYAVGDMIRLNDEERVPGVEEVLEKWFISLAENPMKLLMDITSKHPFPDVRCPVFVIFQALASQLWGQRYLNEYPGFIEYLLDRSTETDKSCRYQKYLVVKTLADSSTVANVFGNVIVVRLTQYVNEGPHFVKVESAVTFDGDI